MKPTCKASLNTNTDENDTTIIDQAHSHIYVGSTYLSGRQVRPIKNNYLRMKKMKNFLAAGAIALSCLMISGCYGSFKLTTTLYDVNMDIQEDVLKEVVFVIFCFTAYPLSTFVDALILNTIEYWTGSNPMATNLHNDIYFSAGGTLHKISRRDKRIVLDELSGQQRHMELSYDKQHAIWYITENGVQRKAAELVPANGHNEAMIRFYKSNSQPVCYSLAELKVMQKRHN